MKTFRYHFALIFMFCLLGCHSNSKKSSTETNSVSIKTENEDSVALFSQKISSESKSIVPGKSVGDIHIGDKPEQIVERLGKPSKGEAGMCKSLNRWFYGEKTSQKSLSIFSECDPNDDMRPHVQWIRTTDPEFKTTKGLAVGSTTQEIEKTFPDMEILGNYRDTLTNEKIVLLTNFKKGITFELSLSQTGTCRAILINKAEKTPPLAYFDFYPELKLEKPY